MPTYNADTLVSVTGRTNLVFGDIYQIRENGQVYRVVPALSGQANSMRTSTTGKFLTYVSVWDPGTERVVTYAVAGLSAASSLTKLRTNDVLVDTSVVPNKSYRYAGGLVTDPVNFILITAPTTTPTVGEPTKDKIPDVFIGNDRWVDPTVIAKTINGSTSITLTWPAQADDTKYEIIRTTSPVTNFSGLTATFTSSLPTYNDTSITAGTAYYYYVRRLKVTTLAPVPIKTAAGNYISRDVMITNKRVYGDNLPGMFVFAIKEDQDSTVPTTPSNGKACHCTFIDQSSSKSIDILPYLAINTGYAITGAGVFNATARTITFTLVNAFTTAQITAGSTGKIAGSYVRVQAVNTGAKTVTVFCDDDPAVKNNVNGAIEIFDRYGYYVYWTTTGTLSRSSAVAVTQLSFPAAFQMTITGTGIGTASAATGDRHVYGTMPTNAPSDLYPGAAISFRVISMTANSITVAIPVNKNGTAAINTSTGTFSYETSATISAGSATSTNYSNIGNRGTNVMYNAPICLVNKSQNMANQDLFGFNAFYCTSYSSCSDYLLDATFRLNTPKRGTIPFNIPASAFLACGNYGYGKIYFRPRLDSSYMLGYLDAFSNPKISQGGLNALWNFTNNAITPRQTGSAIQLVNYSDDDNTNVHMMPDGSMMVGGSTYSFNNTNPGYKIDKSTWTTATASVAYNTAVGTANIPTNIVANGTEAIDRQKVKWFMLTNNGKNTAIGVWVDTMANTITWINSTFPDTTLNQYTVTFETLGIPNVSTTLPSTFRVLGDDANSLYIAFNTGAWIIDFNWATNRVVNVSPCGVVPADIGWSSTEERCNAGVHPLVNGGYVAQCTAAPQRRTDKNTQIDAALYGKIGSSTVSRLTTHQMVFAAKSVGSTQNTVSAPGEHGNQLIGGYSGGYAVFVAQSHDSPGPCVLACDVTASEDDLRFGYLQLNIEGAVPAWSMFTYYYLLLPLGRRRVVKLYILLRIGF